MAKICCDRLIKQLRQDFFNTLCFFEFFQKFHTDRPIFSHIFAITCIAVIILCIPTLLIHDIIITSDEKSLYSIGVSKLAANNNCFLFKLNLWLTGILFKVRVYAKLTNDHDRFQAIPSVLLVVFTVALFTNSK